MKIVAVKSNERRIWKGESVEGGRAPLCARRSVEGKFRKEKT